MKVFKMLFKLALLVLMALMVSGTPEYRHIVSEEHGVEVHQDIMFDDDEEIAIITVGPVPDLPSDLCGATQTVNFHDFKTNYMAFKDIHTAVCHVTVSPVSILDYELYYLKKDSETVVRHAKESLELMTAEEVKKLAGEKIYAFCREYKTYQMMLLPEPRIKRSANKRAKRKCGWWARCNYCLIEVD